MIRPPSSLLTALALAALAYAPLLASGPAYDDRRAVLANPAAASVPEALRGLLRPPPHRGLTDLSFALNRALLGDTPLALHLGSLAVHLGAAAAAGRALALLGLPGIWGAAWFAFHPLSVHAGGYLAQRGAALEALLAFLCLGAYLRSRDGGPRLPALGWAVLALGAKETAAGLPLLLGVVELTHPRPGAWRRWLPFAGLPLMGLLKFAAIPAEQAPATGSGVSFAGHLAVQPAAVLDYLAKTLLPFPLRFFHDRGLTASWPASALLLAAGAWLLLGPRRHATGRAALGLFLAPLAVEALLPLPDPAFYHRAYPGLLGAALAFAWLAARLPRGLACAALALLALGTFGEARTWASAPERSRRDVRGAPRADVTWGNRGWDLLRDGRPEEALRRFGRGLVLPTGEVRLRLGRAAARIALGRVAEGRLEIDALMTAFPEEDAPVRLALEEAWSSGDRERLLDVARRARGRVRDPETEAWISRTLGAGGG